MMKTELLCLEDSYMKEFDAKIVAVDGNKVELDKTAFYPESGGQLGDKGKLIANGKEFQVLNTKKEQGKAIHYLENADGLNANDNVHGAIDWDTRYLMMRMHTAAHILSTIINFQTQALITGNQLGQDKSRIDFDLETFDREALADYFKSANEIINWNLPLKTYTISVDDMLNDKKLCKLAKGLPPGLEQVRIVEIENFDKQADGGTHVKNTSEVGKLVFLDAENKGASNRRIYFSLE